MRLEIYCCYDSEYKAVMHRLKADNVKVEIDWDYMIEENQRVPLITTEELPLAYAEHLIEVYGFNAVNN